MAIDAADAFAEPYPSFPFTHVHLGEERRSPHEMLTMDAQAHVASASFMHHFRPH
jgi:hypothetical protein